MTREKVIKEVKDAAKFFIPAGIGAWATAAFGPGPVIAGLIGLAVIHKLRS